MLESFGGWASLGCRVQGLDFVAWSIGVYEIRIESVGCLEIDLENLPNHSPLVPKPLQP